MYKYSQNIVYSTTIANWKQSSVKINIYPYSVKTMYLQLYYNDDKWCHVNSFEVFNNNV